MSISVEVLIYFFFFLTLRFIGQSGLLNIGVLCLCVIAKIAKVHNPIFDCMAFFYIGGLSAIALQHLENTKYHKIFNTLLLCVIFIASMLIYAFKLYQLKYFPYLFLMTYTPNLLYFASHNINVHSKVQKVVEAAGNMTYSSYLIHFPIQITIALFFTYSNQSIPFYSLNFFIAFIAATLVASFMIYRYFEMPAQAYIRNRFK